MNKINWNKVIGTIFFFLGSYIRTDLMFAPNTLSIISFIALVLYMLFS